MCVYAYISMRHSLDEDVLAFLAVVTVFPATKSKQSSVKTS